MLKSCSLLVICCINISWSQDFRNNFNVVFRPGFCRNHSESLCFFPPFVMMNKDLICLSLCLMCRTNVAYACEFIWPSSWYAVIILGIHVQNQHQFLSDGSGKAVDLAMWEVANAQITLDRPEQSASGGLSGTGILLWHNQLLYYILREP